MPAFNQQNLQLIADGDEYAIRKFVEETTPRCVRLVRWHLDDRGWSHRADLLDEIPVTVAYDFIRLLRREGLPGNPKQQWFALLVRTLLLKVWEIPPLQRANA